MDQKIEDSQHGIPGHIATALESIHQGSTANEHESLILEFKEDPQVVSSRSQTGGKGNPRAQLFEKLIDEAICMANSDVGTGHIVIGVADKTSGQGAFTGTECGEEEVARTIFNRTEPNLRVDVKTIEAYGCRLLLIFIPEAFTLYTRKDGRATRRQGTSCEPLDQPQRQAIIAARANPDYSNQLSRAKEPHYRLDVIEEARTLLQRERMRKGEDASGIETTTGVLRQLGLTNEAGHPKKAADILFGESLPGEVTIRHLWRNFPGVDPAVAEFSGPLILALPALRRLILENSGREIDRVLYPDGQEIAIPRFPEQAVDEVVVNALIHRDWRLPSPVVIEQSPHVLKVWSPGPLPDGVTTNNLLTTQSIPRNNRLMSAMRILGLAEESSRGFDRMWASMLRTGRDAPEVEATQNSVEVVLAAGQPDTTFMQALAALTESFGPELAESVNTLIVLWHLWHSPMITEKTAMEKTQASRVEVKELMAALRDLGVLDTVRGADEWVLSAKAQKTMGKLKPGEIAAVTVQEWIETRLNSGEALSSAEVSEKTGISRQEATEHLRHLRTLGRAHIDPTGPQRGPGTKWIAL
ncbi:ATP-binding protein [Corynebacterium cystitidis]|uniref:Predicted transcriptional regulator, contains HTH domain n=1 Tax=Corynebacterium cystitidis DSM 20524 TaxID=1121357 RepID=A0A1H9VTX2_9CORY|nr:ATP-binding protein [Corynebacterium cystitidis]WJY81094.1 Divergent AAA domain protein [Corynebacterium cystitidis DSM 20524]SES24991.1 Predicted transcriptional regulator, contains HTH domain [Corynebacterium cystitidis DSM 20524]SNV90026.1 ATP-dependent DNA helicase [Corynebacterium cystitidis]